jgi:hypothetical protein
MNRSSTAEDEGLDYATLDALHDHPGKTAADFKQAYDNEFIDWVDAYWSTKLGRRQ